MHADVIKMFLPWVRGVASQAAPLPLNRLQGAITPTVCAALQKYGVTVIDNVFSDAMATTLRQEVQALQEHMHTNCTFLVTNPQADLGPQLLPKRNIFEAELMQSHIQAIAPRCSLLQRDSTLRVMLGFICQICPHWNIKQLNCSGMLATGRVFLCILTLTPHSMDVL